MRTALIVALAAALLSARSQAQLFLPDAQGLAMGHVLLNVSDVRAHEAFWQTCFDAQAVRVGTLRGMVIPGLVVLFRAQAPSGPSDGTTINHLGLKLQSLSRFTERFDQGGFKYDPPRIGRENTPQTYVTGPDGFRMELVEDAQLPVPAMAHHLHYWLAQPDQVKRWYVEMLLVRPTQRGPYPSGDVPGMNLTFAPLGTQKTPGVPTRGRLIDGIGFDVNGLRDFARRAKSRGVVFERDYARDPELNLMSVSLTDPWGATIRLTEGLAAISGKMPFTYLDSFVVGKPLD